ncbi:hypothetical protein T4B_12068 [Trichinella pseudospiralis]|uniref:Uncharacterized protein n=1 Tax=Trichinella pseudospiralis TaxID=6337 RepID=A0A0V1GA81_TRIPS|nr:hypothetical protein T4B_12068 [Trichinella pseudospiralis]
MPETKSLCESHSSNQKSFTAVANGSTADNTRALVLGGNGTGLVNTLARQY